MLVVFGAIVGVPVAAVAYFFLKLVAETQQYVFETLPGELGFDSQPSWWSIPFLALSGLIVAASIRFLPGTSGHKPAEGFKTGGAVRPIELPGNHPRVVRDAQPRRRARPRSAADRDRQRHGRARRAPDQARRAGDGKRRDRGRGELRRDRDAPRLSARRRVSADGGRRARRSADERRARAGVARGRHRVADLHRPRRLDRIRDVLARGPGHSSRRQPDRRRVPVGDRDRRPGGRPRHDHPEAGARAPADRRRAKPCPDAARRRRDRRPRPDLRRGDRQVESPTSSSPARTSSRR